VVYIRLAMVVAASVMAGARLGDDAPEVEGSPLCLMASSRLVSKVTPVHIGVGTSVSGHGTPVGYAATGRHCTSMSVW
jgi:hypothetical protein